MKAEDLKKRTKRFAIDVIKFAELLPNNPAGWVLGKQMIRAGTSVGANYRAACKSRSQAEFVAKIGIVEEEADESCFWLELCEESNMVRGENLKSLHREAGELTAIMAASRKSASRSMSL